MKTFINITLFILFGFLNNPLTAQKAMDLSQDVLTSFKMNQPIAEFETELENIPFQILVDELDTDSKKQAFWLNIYVTYSQKRILSTEKGKCDKKCKKQKTIAIAGRMFSLTDILYLILLHSKCPVSGMQKLHSPKWEQQLRVGYPDGRVILALDSDSDIANEFTYFEPEKINHQLNVLSLMFIKKNVYYNKETNEVFIPKWLKHFKREFGKKQGIYAGLRTSELISKDAEPKIIYSDNIPTFK